jgi:hypothetical protein
MKKTLFKIKKKKERKKKIGSNPYDNYNMLNNDGFEIDNNQHKDSENKINNEKDVSSIKENKELVNQELLLENGKKTKYTSKETNFLSRKRKNKYEKKFPDKSFGRLSKQSKINGKKGKHTKDFSDDGKRKITKDCLLNVDFIIRSILEEEDPNILLPEITLKHLLGKGNNKDLEQLLSKTLIDIYDILKMKNSENNNNNKKVYSDIKIFLEEKNDDNKAIYNTKCLLNKRLAEFIYIYIRDKQDIFIDNNNISLPGFDTYKSLNDFSPKSKKLLKNNILKMLEKISGEELEKEKIEKKTLKKINSNNKDK